LPGAVRAEDGDGLVRGGLEGRLDRPPASRDGEVDPEGHPGPPPPAAQGPPPPPPRLAGRRGRPGGSPRPLSAGRSGDRRGRRAPRPRPRRGSTTTASRRPDPPDELRTPRAASSACVPRGCPRT